MNEDTSKHEQNTWHEQHKHNIIIKYKRIEKYGWWMRNNYKGKLIKQTKTKWKTDCSNINKKAEIIP